jgi:hypothetical protein
LPSKERLRRVVGSQLPDLFLQLPELIGHELRYHLVYDWSLGQQSGRLRALTPEAFGLLSGLDYCPVLHRFLPPWGMVGAHTA